MRAVLSQKKSVSGLLAAVTILLLAAAPVTAQIAGPCAESITKYCSGITPGGGRIKQCLEGHSDDLPLACRDWLDKMRVKADDMNRACIEEIAAFCNFDKPDQMRIVQCLEERYVNLRLNCREKLREFTDPIRNP
jgi:hypothetical protein